jgi:hypothetical protein
MSSVEDTWARRDFPILVVAFRRFESDANRPANLGQLEEIRRDLDLAPRDFVAGLHALADAEPPYIELETASGWSDERAGGGYISAISERARRELGAWPSPEGVLEQLIEALARASDAEPEPERQGRRRAAADVLGGMARDIAVSVIAARLGRLV